MIFVYQPPSLSKILKKLLQQVLSYKNVPFLIQNGQFSRLRFFSENLLISLVPFIHAYIHAKNQCQILINEILTIKEYWNLIGREPFLATNSESFCKMLMNHKNFHLIQIPDKTNDTIFLKSPKTLFLGQFWPFLVIFAWWGFFPKKSSSVTCNYTWAPNTMLSLKEN